MSKYRRLPRYEVEKLVVDFIEKNKIHAEYGKDTEGLFKVNFIVEEKMATDLLKEWDTSDLEEHYYRLISDATNIMQEIASERPRDDYSYRRASSISNAKRTIEMTKKVVAELKKRNIQLAFTVSH